MKPDSGGRLFENGVQSIKLGVEDYESDEPNRHISAVRNLYAGILLLAKEVLVRTVPDADPQLVIAKHYKIKRDDDRISFEPSGDATIGFPEIQERFKAFDLRIDTPVLKRLQKLRNEWEHRYGPENIQGTEEEITKALPVVRELLGLIEESPREVLGKAWEKMLSVETVYQAELANCRATFAKVEWLSPFPNDATCICPRCLSSLVWQKDLENACHESLECLCRACGYEFSAEEAIEGALAEHFWEECFDATADQHIQDCPECGCNTYLLTEEERGCAWCGLVLNGCCRTCSAELAPANVNPDDLGSCSYCYNLYSKPD